MGKSPYCRTIIKILYKRKACLLTRNFQIGQLVMIKLVGIVTIKIIFENAEYACKIKLSILMILMFR